MNGKTFVSVSESDLFGVKAEELIINVDHIILVNKKDKSILFSDGNKNYLTKNPRKFPISKVVRVQAVERKRDRIRK